MPKKTKATSKYNLRARAGTPVSAQPKFPLKHHLAYGMGLACWLASGTALANPAGGVVAAGNAQITSSGSTVTIGQQSDRAVVDWQSFDIQQGEHTHFQQPSANSVTLNRIRDAKASFINGQLTANGKIYAVNPNGILFGPNAAVDVGGLVATTSGISNENFMAGRDKFDQAGRPDGKIINQGSITVKDAGLVGLVAPQVENSGTIHARLGRVQLSSGDKFSLDLAGDQMISVEVSPAVAQQLVRNTGTITADGGRIELSAAQAQHAVTQLVQQQGKLQADSIGVKNGEIILSAGGSIATDPEASRVEVSGQVLARGQEAGTKGGAVRVHAPSITVKSGAHIDASGKAGGGEVLVGGEYQGGSAQAGKATTDFYAHTNHNIVPRAKRVTMEQGSSIDVSATEQGDGGRAILWSDEETKFFGSILGKGGAQGGKGGFVETSGHETLRIGGTVDLTDMMGGAGTWLLDPTNITINNHATTGDGTNTYSATQVQTLSAGANVSLSATNNITLNLGTENLNLTNNRNITLSAGNQILTTSAGTITANGSGGITLTATNGIVLSNALALNAGSNGITLSNAVTSSTDQTFSTSGTLTTNGIAVGAHNLELISGDVVINGNLSGTGTLGLRPYATVSTVRLNFYSGDYNLDTAEIGKLSDGWTMIDIGRLDGQNSLSFGGASFTDPVTLRSYGVGLFGNFTGTGNAALTINDGGASFYNNSTISTAGGAVTFGNTLNFDNSGGTITTSGGAINFNNAVTHSGTTGDTITLNAGTGTITTASTFAVGANNLIMIADDVALGGNVSGTGTLTLQPSSTNRVMCMNYSTGACASAHFDLNTAEINALVDGWSGINIGRADIAADAYIGASTWKDPVVFLGNGYNRNFTGAIVGTGNASFTSGASGQVSGVTLGSGSSITTAGGFVDFFANVTTQGTASISTSNGYYRTQNQTFLSTSGTGLTVSTGSGNITFGDQMSGGTAGQNVSLTTTGQTKFNWSINGPYNLTINTGTLVPNGSAAWGGTTALGAVNVTTTNSNFTLQNLTTTGNVALNAGTGTITTNAISTGAGNLTFTADGLVLGGNITGTGALLVKPSTASKIFNINNGTTNLYLTTAQMDYIQAGWGSLTFGNSADSGLLTVGGYNWKNTVNFITGSGNIALGGTSTLASGASYNATTGSGNILSTAAGTITTSGAGGFTLTSGSDLTLTHALNLTASGTGSIIERANNNIIHSGGGVDTTASGSITLNSDWDASGAGAISLAAGSNLISSGAGDITLGGGSNPLTGNAVGVSGYGSGIMLDATTIQSAGGIITMNGQGWVSSTCISGTVDCHGVYLANNSKLRNSGAGTLTVKGLSGGDATTNNGLAGVRFSGSSTSVANGLTSLTGTASQPSLSNTTGIATTGSTFTSTGTGDILFTSTNATGSRGYDSVGTTTITSGGNFTYVGNTLNGGTNATITTAGDIIFRPYTAGTTVGIGTGSGTLNISDTWLSKLNPGTNLWLGGYGNPGDVGYISNAGNLTINETRSFTKNINFLSAGNILSSGTGTITTTSAGNILLAALGDINVTSAQNFTASGTGSIFFRANENIANTGGGATTTQGGSIVLNADRDANGSGAININRAASYTSNGGAITLGGGLNPLTGFATGNITYNKGIFIGYAGGGQPTFAAAGGIITMNGLGYANATCNNACHGIELTGGILSTTGNGQINLYGMGGGTTATNSNHGVVLGPLSGFNTTITAQNGDISVTGSTVETSSNPGRAISLTGGNVLTTSGTGNIILTDANTVAGTAGLRSYNSAAVTSGGNITYIGNVLDGTSLSANWTAANDIIIRPYTTGTTVGIGAGAGTLAITDGWLANFTYGNNLWLGGYGNPGDFGYISTAGNMTISEARSFSKNLNFLSAGTISTTGSGSSINTTGTGSILLAALGDINLPTAQSFNATGTGSVTLRADNNISVSANAAMLTTQGGAITLNSDRDASGAGAIYVRDSTFNSNGGSIVLGGGLNPLTDFAVGSSTTAGSNSHGVYLSNATVRAAGGDITVNGTGWSSVTCNIGNCKGIQIDSAGLISTTGSGNIWMNGISGTNNATYTVGIEIKGTANITAVNGNINLYGYLNKSSPNGTDNSIVFGGSNTIQTTGTGNINLTTQEAGVGSGGLGSYSTPSLLSGNDIVWVGNKLTSGGSYTAWNAAHDIVIRPYTAGTTIGIGSGAGTLSLTDSFLSKLTWGNNLWLGGYGNPGDVGYVSNAGNLTINETRSFSKNINFLSAGNILSSGTGTITTTSAGNILLAALGSISLTTAQNFTASGSGAITEQANANITHSGGGITTTGGGNIVLNASRAGTGGSISLSSGSNLVSNGGAITLGGNATPSTLAAVGTATQPNGISLSAVTINAGGGAISMRGQGYAGSTTNANGLNFVNSTVQTNGIGTITLNGVGSGTGTGQGMGLFMNGGTISTVNGDITVTGLGGGGASSNNNRGVSLGGGGEKMQVTGSGNIVVTGTGGQTAGSDANAGIDLGGSFLTASGNLTLTAIKGTGGNSYGISNGGGSPVLGGAGATGTLNIIADNFSFSALPTIQTTGAVSIRPYTAGTSVGVGSGSGSLSISDSLLAAIAYGTDLWLGGYGNPGDAGYISNAGDLTINSTRSFAHNINFLSNGNILTSGAGTVTTTGAANIMLTGLNIGIGGQNFTAAGTGSITEWTNGSIIHNGGGVLTTNGGSITLNADRDGGGNGAIALSAGSNLASNGGTIILGGGTSPGTTAAYGSGSSYAQGISLTGVTINGGTNGNVIMRGVGYAGTNTGATPALAQHGIFLNGATVQTSGTGTITFDGTGAGINAGSGTGVALYNGSTVSAQNGNIAITGHGAGGSTGANGNGVSLSFVGLNKVQSTGSGDISITGFGGSLGAGSSSNHGIVLNSNTGGVLSASATVKLYGYAGNGSNSYGIANTAGGGGTIGGASATNQIDIATDTMNWAAVPTIQTTGQVLLRAANTGTSIGVAGGAGNLQLTTAFLDALNAGSVQVGLATNDHLITANAYSGWNAPVTFTNKSYNILLNGMQTVAANKSFTATTVSGGNIIIGTGGGVTTSGTGTIALNAANQITTTGAGSLTSASGNIGLTGTSGIALSNALGIISTSGNINLNSPVTSTTSQSFNAGTGTIITGSIAVGANSLTMISDDVAIGGTLSGAGTLTLKPSSNARPVNINFGSGGYFLSATEVNNLADGWNQINIGNSAGTGALYVGATTWNDPVTFFNNYKMENQGALTGNGNASFTFDGAAGGSGYTNMFNNITTNGGIFRATGFFQPSSGTITTNGGSATFGQITGYGNGAFTVNTSGGNISTGVIVENDGTIKALNFSAGVGTINFGGVVAGPWAVTASGGSLTFNGVWGASNALSSVSLTSANTSYTLPNLTSTGNVTLSAGTGTITTGAIATGAGNLTLTSDDVAIGGNLSGTGMLTLQPSSDNRIVRVVDGSGDFHLDGSELAHLTDGWGHINIGRTTSTADFRIYDSSFADPVTFRNAGYMAQYGNVTGTGNASITYAGGSFDDYGTTTTNNQSVTVNPTLSSFGASIFTNGGALNLLANLGVWYGASPGGFSASTSGGAIAIGGAIYNNGGNTAGKLVSLNAGSGNLSFGSTVDGQQNLTATADNITFGGAWGSSTPLGAVSLTSTASLSLPSITASSIFARTTGATSDITLASGKVLAASGTGNALTLAAGRNFINNAGAGALSLTGGGRWLIYSNNPTDTTGEQLLSSSFNRYSCSYSAVGACAGGAITIPGTGNGLLYSTTPLLTATANVQNITYGDAATLSGYGYTISGYNSGDTGDVVTGTLTGTSPYAAGTDIGTYGLSYASGSLTSAMGYGFTYASNASAIVVGQRALTASLTGTVSKTYDATTAATLAVGNYLLGNVYSGDAVALNNPTSGIYDNKDKGTGKNVSVTGLSISGAKAGNYTLASTSASGNVGTVLAKDITVSLTGTVSKTYDTTDAATLAAGNYNLSGVVGSENVLLNNPASGIYNDIHAGTGKNVSVSGLALSGTDIGNYNLVSTSASGTIGAILAKTLNVGLTGTVSKTYDGDNSATLAAGNYTLDSALGSDVVALNNPASGTYDNLHAGTGKLVSVSGLALTGANAGDYQLASSSLSAGIGTIIAKTLTAGLTGTISKTYDGNNNAALAAGNYTLSGGTVGSDVVLLNNPVGGTYDTIHAGTGKTISVSGLVLTGANASDYQLASASASGNVGTILAKTLTAGLTGTVSKTYDGNNTATNLIGGNYTLTGGTIGSDVVTLNNPTSGTYDDIHAGTGKTISISGLSLTGANASDYQLASGSITGGIGTILAKTLTAGLTGTVSKTYDGDNTVSNLVAGNYTLTGGTIGMDVVTLSHPTSGSYNDKNAGSNKSVSVSGLVLNGANASDYQLALTSASGTIGTILTKTINAGLTGTISKTYDGNANATLAASNYSLSGVIGMDDVGLNNPTSGLYDNKNAASGKTVSVNGLALVGGDASNYTLSSASASASVGTILAKALSILGVTVNDKIYDGTNSATINAASASFSGRVGTDDVNLDQGTLSASFADAHAGTGKAVNISGFSLSGAESNNYTLDTSSFTASAANITPKGLAVAVISGQNKTYGDADAALGYTYNGLVGTDTSASFSGALSRAAGENVGSYNIAQGTLIGTGDYAIASFAPNTFTIDRALLTATANNASRQAGEANPVLTFYLTGLKLGDTSNVVSGINLSTLANAGSAPGTYDISISGGMAANYTIANYVNGMLTVGMAPQASIPGATPNVLTDNLPGLILRQNDIIPVIYSTASDGEPVSSQSGNEPQILPGTNNSAFSAKPMVFVDAELAEVLGLGQ